MKSFKTVDEYISNSSSEVQPKLKELRKIIKETAPKAEERISYAMPSYWHKGQLVFFSAFKTHIGLYIPPPTIEEHKEDLKHYETAKATVRFPLSEKLHEAIIAAVEKILTKALLPEK